MKLQRYAGVAALALAGSVALTACGTDNNSSATSPSSSGGGSIACSTGTLQAAGSTAQANAMSAWIKAYQQACNGATVNYGGGGSGAGVQQFTDGKIDFAGSDFPLGASNQAGADKRCASGPAIDLPMTPGPIAIGYNLPGVSSLNLSAATLAKIFSGKITKWDDAAIAGDNAGAKLPSTGIQTFHRSDGSGTSFNFTNYLTNEAKSDWTYGANKQWPAPGGQGAKGSASVAQGVKSTTGAIGYFEQSFATQNSIPMAKIGNAAGKFVELTADNTVNFLAKAKVTGSNGDIKLAFDYTNTDTNAYPNVLVTYEIVCSKGNDSAKLPLLKGFLGYLASDAGQGLLPTSGYVKLPSNVQSQVQASIKALS